MLMEGDKPLNRPTFMPGQPNLLRHNSVRPMLAGALQISASGSSPSSLNEVAERILSSSEIQMFRNMREQDERCRDGKAQ
jgi:hypothetical protein